MDKITDDIFKISIPFENIFTSVFIIKTEDGAVIFDCGTYASDVDEYILPNVKALGLENEVKHLFLSHSHSDHAGGLERLCGVFNDAKIYTRSDKIAKRFENTCLPSDGEEIASKLYAITIKGHADDCMALFDKRSGTLITGDCLQLYGVFGRGDWGTGISDTDSYFKNLEKLRKMDIKMIIASHDYHPLGQHAMGETVKEYIDTCEKAVRELLEFYKQNCELNEDELRNLYKNSFDLPIVSKWVFKTLKNATVG
jgi:glyoxylase-like metal-dependent hydrolase (beta-lactamase superfamily II)